MENLLYFCVVCIELLFMKYPIGIQNFEKIRREGYAYVDKTALMYKTAAVALQQIEEKGYAQPFASDPRQLFKIGINFSTDTKLIDDWKIV